MSAGLFVKNDHILIKISSIDAEDDGGGGDDNFAEGGEGSDEPADDVTGKNDDIDGTTSFDDSNDDGTDDNIRPSSDNDTDPSQWFGSSSRN